MTWLDRHQAPRPEGLISYSTFLNSRVCALGRNRTTFDREVKQTLARFPRRTETVWTERKFH